MIGEFVAQGETEPIWLAVVTNDIETGQLRLFAEILGEIGCWEIRSGANHDAAITLVEPLGLRPDASRLRFAAFHSPSEHLHRVGELFLGLLHLLVHLVSGRGATQMSQASTADQAMRRIVMIHRRQHPAGFQKLTIRRTGIAALRVNLRCQAVTVTNCSECQLAGTAHATQHLDTFGAHHAYLTLALFVLELNQPHEASSS